MTIRTIALVMGAIACATPTAAQHLTEVWRTGGFEGPESVSYDAERQVLYVSNIVGEVTAKDGNGYISRLDLDGNVIDMKWVTGLNAPKGGTVFGSALFVTDIDELVEIHIPTSQLRSQFITLGDGAIFFNDVAAVGDVLALAIEDEHPEVYVSDTFANTIWLLKGGALAVWYDQGGLDGPNGLTVLDGKLIVAELGDVSGGFANLVPGTVKQIDLETKALTEFGPPGQIGALDGIEPNGRGGVTVTDNSGGRLLEFMPGEPETLIAEIEPGSADHEWVPELNLFVIPNLQTGEVVAYLLSE